jgi:hypothetical protein
LLLLTGCFLTACPAEDTESSVAGWQGDEPHFVVKGFLDGEEVDFSIDDDATGLNVWCEREYGAPLVDGEPDVARAEHLETTIAGTVMINGEERSFELELLNHALQDEEPGTELNVIPRVDGTEPESDELWVEWEWADVEGETLFEAAAQEGMVVHELASGDTGEDSNVIPDGEGFVGGFIEARWSLDEKLTISFTVLCTEHEVEGF